jgi:methyl-accepting chemotaxis protein
MIVLGDESITLFERLPNCLESAEKYLDQAEVNFSDSAFVPFWDSIEEAVKMLGYFNEGVQHIGKNSSHYTELIGKYEDTPPQFPLARQSVEKLDVGTATANRMKAIVGTAQRNFQFAMIYEQHKTNQILVAGFTNLANALDQMTWKITNSIDDLAGSVDVMTSTLNESLHAIHSRVGDIADIAEKTSQKTSQHHDELMEEISKGSARERKVLKMLDNIQRGRRSSL